MIRNDIKQHIKDAMKNRQIAQRDALRYLDSKITQIEVDTRQEVTDEQCISLIKRLIKMNNDTLSYSPKDADKIKLEITTWERYLPTMLTEEETRYAIELIIKGNMFNSIKQMGAVMGAIKKSTISTQVDMALASKIVKELLS